MTEAYRLKIMIGGVMNNSVLHPQIFTTFLMTGGNFPPYKIFPVTLPEFLAAQQKSIL
jgi:hypothetical protein